MRVKLLLLLLVVSLLAGACVSQPLPARQEREVETPAFVSLPSVTPTSVAAPVITPPPVQKPMRDGLINLTHLQRLTEIVDWNGEPIGLVHIYSEAPDYGWVDASGEGIACVDDVARAALVYLMYYQRTGDAQALELARAALNFVLYMQAEDGEYYNFVFDRQGTINRDGRTSYKSWSWWAARAQWVLAAAVPVFRVVDSAYASRLETAYLRGEQALQRSIGPVGAYNDLHGVAVPAWLIGNGTDLSALAILGLAAYYEANPNPRTRHLMTNLANGVVAYRLGDARTYPFGAFPSTTTSTALWHAWGSHQVHALAIAGRLLERDDWLEAARTSADQFYARLLAADFLNEMLPLPVRGGQIAYGIEVMTAGFWEFFRATGEQRYARYAGLSNAWLFGNNMAGVAMYDPETGRTFDGIDGPTPFRVNRNAGAESTIEALLALLMVEDHPLVTAYYSAKPAQSFIGWVVEAENAQPISGSPRYGQRGWTGEARFSNDRYYALRAGDSIQTTLDIPQDQAYVFYVSHLLRAAPKAERVTQAVQTALPVQIDGVLNEWQNAGWVSVDQPENILRGAAGWPGAEKASFRLAFLWDAEYLYIAAEVRDDRHVQNEVGPSVWRGDALWLYFNLGGDRRSIDAKLTLAQTPQGGQVWNWRAQGFQPDARLAWQEVEGGYIYEAALSWQSLNYLNPQKQPRLYYDAGMGFGSGGFINWSGLDPDTPSNLLPLDFVAEWIPINGETSTEPGKPLDTALKMTILTEDEGQPPLFEAVIPQRKSPDRDYLWLEAVFEAPVNLPAGRYRLQMTYAGSQNEQEAVVDAVWILPQRTCKQFTFAENSAFRLLNFCYDWWTGEKEWMEK